MSRCWIALGGNQGDVAAAMERAGARLAALGLSVVRRSPLFDTTPVGAAAGARFLNAAAELETSLTPLEVLVALQRVEAAAGRARDVRWGPRPLDLDLLFFEQRQIVTPQLTIPHPALWYRRFVLDPLVCIAPDLTHPAFGVMIAELRARLCVRPLPVAVRGNGPMAAEIGAAVDSFGDRVARATDHHAAAIVLNCGLALPPSSTDAALRTVEVCGLTDPVQAARDVLTAALDEPVPLE